MDQWIMTNPYGQPVVSTPATARFCTLLPSQTATCLLLAVTALPVLSAGLVIHRKRDCLTGKEVLRRSFLSSDHPGLYLCAD